MIRVLVVDDSAVVRQVLCKELSKADDIEVVGTAIDPFVARDKIVALRPDVLTLDLEMPRMGGLAFLSKLMKYFPLPVVVVSSLTPEGSEAAVKALELGAVDVIAKPGSAYSVAEISRMLADRIRAAVAARPRQELPPTPSKPPPVNLPMPGDRIVAVGASTGGTEAIKCFLTGLPETCPPIVVVQHMPAGFTAKFAERLNQVGPMEVREAADGDRLRRGLALVAPGNRHLTVRRRGDGWRAEVRTGPMVRYQRPSVDVLFYSVAEAAGPASVGVILTGMGDDGARGLLAMHEAGAVTFGQDEESCAVYGMPREALRMGAIDRVLPLRELASHVVGVLARRGRAEVLCTSKRS